VEYYDIIRDDSVNVIASGNDINDKSKYSVYTNPSTGLYYRLHILNVRLSDLRTYVCQAVANGVVQYFYLQLILIGTIQL
jgi:hypothetical protein